MKRLYIYLLIGAILCSCENKRDTDSLAGFWQMTAWQSPDGEKIAGKEDRIFYSVQLSLMKFHKLPDGYDNYYLSYYNHKGDSLVIDHPVKFVNDSLVSLSDLARYGVPSDGRFHIDVLNEEHMQLSSPETGVLVFRKY